MTDETGGRTAVSKHAGERCREPAVAGGSVCRRNGAGGEPKGSVTGLARGAYAGRTLSHTGVAGAARHAAITRATACGGLRRPCGIRVAPGVAVHFPAPIRRWISQETSRGR